MLATRNDPPVKVRFPGEVLKKLDAAAKKAGRSRNSEILVRLSDSFKAKRAQQA